ncbi:BZ3500_MvSof-1268-A1-R1_Chr4-2g07098 [Microbotryum saponariae]|uniref:BZ3500_MvSof-1268-A1-R1_Chr4-2g07098 protein n=1 Tax=Microbotryum saponariae TaxID=289078 RepID=A0A2X0KZ66_9BASI|nr:BZ3500_MvSof-1268-A1-R1_Chr4-2g07098 [Microbotryum saponariae]SDA06763.1 BZ3501_MvSof-1269-A2-R1_Chr4-2g06809 [Microbotryum saponariae]
MRTGSALGFNFVDRVIRSYDRARRPASCSGIALAHHHLDLVSLRGSSAMDSGSPDAGPSQTGLAGLPAPESYSLSIKSLSSVAPPPEWSIPLAIPITVPRSVQKRLNKGKELVAKELLRNVNVEVRAGEVLALVGVWENADIGSRFSFKNRTLLDTIACRNTTLEMSSGSVTFAPKDFGSIPAGATRSKGKVNTRKLIGYVRQDDFLLPYLTVRETLTFAAALRLPRSVTRQQRGAIVEQTINELGLRDAAETIVGGLFRKGISGGEKRRLSIGCVLVTLPSVLVLDEPTTGLDSFTAFALLETLSALAKQGRIIVLSVHQPRPDCFKLFDKITLLSRGSVVYSGPRMSILDYFNRLGHPLPVLANPLDFIIDISSVDTRHDIAEVESSERVNKLVLAWTAYEFATGTKRLTDEHDLEVSKAEPGLNGDADGGITRRDSRSQGNMRQERVDARPGWIAQTGYLTVRGLRNVSRNYGQSLGFLAQAVIIGIVVGLAFYHPPETPAGIQSIKTVVFQSTPAFFYLSIIVWCFILVEDLVVFDRENEDGLVQAVPYLLGSFLSYLPTNAFVSIVHCLIIYFMCGFRRDNLAINVLSFCANGIMVQLSSFGYAAMCCAINRSFAQASLLANGFSISFILTAGYLIVNLPAWIAWLRWLGPYFYGFHWIATLQFKGRIFACEGVTGVAKNQCIGDNVLTGLRFPTATPLLVYPLGPPRLRRCREQSAAVLEKDRQADAASGKQLVDIRVRGLGLTVTSRSIASRGKKVEKIILNDVDAFFPAGKVRAIMGPSGAGKSSLLQVLSGRLKSGATSVFSTYGSVTFNDRPYDSSLASLMAFIEQEDAHHLPALTVHETLRYAARLRLPGQSLSQCDARAEEVLRILGLKLCADNLVGGPLLKGISGGEKRRLSLAVQLIDDPPVLFADEPTSGLDSFTAYNIMLTLKDLANQGRTIIVSVHQPRSDVWDIFDHVLLLAKGGLTAYSGPRTDILKTLESCGAVCPTDFNPADFVLDVISVSYRDSLEEKRSAAQVERIIQVWRTSNHEFAQSFSPSPQASPLGTHKQLTAPFIRALPVLLSRSFKNLRRQSDVFVARFANPPFLALLFFLFFGRLSLGPGSAQTRVGALQETTALPFVGMLACLSIFPTERGLFFHEWRSSGRHGVAAFLVAYSLQETAVSIVSSLLWSVVFVFGIKLQQTPRIFIEFWLTSYALISTGESIGIIFSSFFENGGLAVSLVSASITMFAQLNGIISVTVPKWLQIIGWATVTKSQARVQIINEFKGLVFDCTSQDIASGACVVATGEELLQTFSIAPSGTGKFLGIALALTLMFRILSYIALRVRVATL